jgi:ABC-2 type transport system ATP-binding protein
MIHARGLSKSFGSVRAVQGVSLTVDVPGVLGLLGPNGAGKTTTIRMLTGCLEPDEGTVHLAGIDLARNRVEAQRHLGYAPETPPAYPEMTARAYLDHRGRLAGLARRPRATAVENAIARCRLEPVARRRVAGLSKGYRQRVGLAAALVPDPKVLVLDEPASGLDPSQIVGLRTLIRELGSSKIVVLSSHILGEIERVSDRVVILAGGKLLADGTPRDVAARARTYIIAEIAPPPADAPRSDAGLIDWAHTLVADANVGAADTSEPVGRGWVRLRIPTRPDQPQAEALVATVSERSARIRELHTERPTLETRFIELIAGRGEP